MQILTPIPDARLPDAAMLWWRSLGAGARPPGWRVPAVDGRRGIALLRDGRVAGVLGLRDSGGGFLRPGRWPAGLMLRLYRAAPATDDLVIDGIAVASRRRGDGARLIDAARQQARLQGRPGLRAEVRSTNSAALAFYAAQGFVNIAQGRFGWPWTGQVVVLRANA